MENFRQETIDWVRQSSLGRGSFGTVDMAVNKSDGHVFAVKSVYLNSCLAAQSEALENEIKMLKSISSPWAVQYLSDDLTSENGTSLVRNLHMEYMPGGTAADVAKDDSILQSWVYCLVAAVNDVHSSGIVHCDIKGRNVLIGSSPSVAKLADFGSAIFATQTTDGKILPRGSPFWMAPEVVRGEYQGPESDVWSLGCTVIEMVTGKPPWEDSGPDTLHRIGYSDELPELPYQLTELGMDFVNKCLRRDRKKRWSCDQLLRHPFVSSSEPLNLIRHASPRCVLDWEILEFSENEDEDEKFGLDSIKRRVGKLAFSYGPIWESDGWVEVRNVTSDEDLGTGLQYLDFPRVESQIGVDTEWVNSEAGHSGGGDEVAVAEKDRDHSFLLGYEVFTASENRLFVNFLFLTAMLCTFICFTIIKILQLFFRCYLRFQSSHVTTLPKLLTLCAVFEIILLYFVSLLVTRSQIINSYSYFGSLTL